MKDPIMTSLNSKPPSFHPPNSPKAGLLQVTNSCNHLTPGGDLKLLLQWELSTACKFQLMLVPKDFRHWEGILGSVTLVCETEVENHAMRCNVVTLCRGASCLHFIHLLGHYLLEGFIHCLIEGQ